MKASSAGGNGYAPVTYGYTIKLVPGTQVATLSAPPSGRYKVGRVLVLESPGQQDTNAGQNITWKLKKAGKKNCQLLYPNNGSVTLRIKSKGTCTVLGTAPGVAGQWLSSPLHVSTRAAKHAPRSIESGGTPSGVPLNSFRGQLFARIRQRPSR